MIETKADRASDCCAVPCFKEEEVARVRGRLPADERVVDLAGFFALLADPMRLRIVLALAEAQELCVCDVANVVGLSMSATSHHLKKLREAGVLTSRNDGKMVWYRTLDAFAAGLALQAQVWRRNASTSTQPNGCCK